MFRNLIFMIFSVVILSASDAQDLSNIGKVLVSGVKERNEKLILSVFVNAGADSKSQKFAKDVVVHFNTPGNEFAYIDCLSDKELGIVLIATTKKEGVETFDIDPLYAKNIGGKWMLLIEPDRIDEQANKLTPDEVLRLDNLWKQGREIERDMKKKWKKSKSDK